VTQVFVNGAVLGAIYAVAAVGFSITFLARGFFDFAFAGVISLVAYCAIISAQALGATHIFLLVVVSVAAPLLSFLLDSLVYRRFRGSRSSRLTLIVVSLGTMTIMINATALVFGDAPLVPVTLRLGGNFNFFEVKATGWQLATLVTSLVIAAGSQALLYHTRWGAKARAVANDRTLAKCVGLDATKISLEVAAIGAAIGAGAGVLSGLDYGLTPAIGFQLLLPAVVASVIGGLGNVSGAAATGFLMGLIEQYSGWFLSAAWQETVLLLILIICLLFRPRGVFGNMLTVAPD
jgi:branched-chain amino acid transport system permease protein